MPTHTTRWMMAFLSVMIVALIGAWAMQESDETKMLIDDLKLQHTGDIEIAVNVRSANGEPLQGVRVRLTESHLSEAFGGAEDAERLVIDSHFTFKKRGVSAIHLSFVKDGYYAERWEFVMSERPQEFWGNVYKIEVGISMIPHPTPAPLNKYEGLFRSDLNGPVSVLFATKKKPLNRASSRPEKPGGQKDAFLGPYMYLDAEVGDDGQLSSVLFSMRRFPVPKPVLDRGFLRLAGANDGDGFLTADVGEIPAIFERGFRNLVEAPRTGYFEALQLYPVDGKEKLFFYCRVGGRFGKGVVTNPPLIIDSGGRNVAIANVVIFLNPTGSTDVSYLHH